MSKAIFEPESLAAFFDRFRRDHPNISIIPPEGAGPWMVLFPDEPMQEFPTGLATKKALIARYPESESPGGNKLLTDKSDGR
jgi:hypothetical protein